MYDKRFTTVISWINDQVNLQKDSMRLSTKNVLFVAGNSGIGKTYSIQRICNNLNLHVIYISTSKCNSSKELDDLITKTCSSSMLQVLLNDTKQKIIIIDEFESMISIDKTINTTFLNLLESKRLKAIPIICITSIDIVKKIGLMKKKCTIINITHPEVNEIYDILIELYPNKDQKFLKQLSEQCNGNITQCIKNIDISVDNNFNNIDEIINTSLLYSQSKATNRNIIRRIIETDVWMIPLKYHENLPNELNKRKISPTKSKQLYKTFMQNLIIFDKLPLDIGPDIFTSIIYPISELPIKKSMQCNGERFTKLLSYMSLQKKYIKESFNSCISDFPLYQLSSYHTNIAIRNNMFFN
jgi:nucleoside-triphosphatase THEP1